MGNLDSKTTKTVYRKPEIKDKKVKLNFFNNSIFMDPISAFFIPPVFAQSY